MVENNWWISEYGDPCRECGFNWGQAPDATIEQVEALPARYAALLAGSTGDDVVAGARWSTKAYVFHVADNLRIWAERLEGVAAGGPTALAAYAQDELAAARNYEAMSVQSALWSLRTATAAWAKATREALARPTTYLHAERGELNAAEITRAPAHDAVHHCWDVTRATGAPATGASATGAAPAPTD